MHRGEKNNNGFDFDAVIIGNSCVENILCVKKLPQLKSHKEVELAGYWTSVGGNGLNVACYAQNIGMKVSFYSKVPEGIYPDVMNKIGRSRLTASDIVKDTRADSPHVYIIVEESGDYSVIVSDRTGLAYSPSDLSPQPVIGSATYVHLDAFTLGSLGTASQIEAANIWLDIVDETGALLSIDLSHALCDNLPDRANEVIRRAQIVFGNAYEATSITGTDDAASAVEALMEMGPAEVVVKDGERGLVYGSALGIGKVPAFRSAIVDTIGAGDGVVAGTLYGLCVGMSIEQASRVGAAVAALVCGGHGSQGADFSMRDVWDLLG